MSDKVEEDQEIEEGAEKPPKLPEFQYSREELLTIAKNTKSKERPKCLSKAFDSEDGRWDPDRWCKATYGSREDSPQNFGDGVKERRKVDIDRDLKRRPSVNDPIERLKESENDEIVLSPQRRSFGTGCHVQQTYVRQLSQPDRDWDRERDRDRDRDREDNRDRTDRQRKIGSGRINIDRDRDREVRDFGSLRDRDRDRDRYDDRDRDRDHWNRDRMDRDRDRDRDWDRRDWDRDRGFDRYRRTDNGYFDRDRRDRDYRDRDRDRGFDKNSRRRNNYVREEEEPEWFTGGPSSQLETIELRGFENQHESDHSKDKSAQKKTDSHHTGDVKSKESTKNVDESEPNHSETPKQDEPPPPPPPQAQPVQVSAADGIADGLPPGFNLDAFLRVPMNENSDSVQSRFASLFHGNMASGDGSFKEECLAAHDERQTSPAARISPALQDILENQQRLQLNPDFIAASPFHTLMPTSAGDNNASLEKSASFEKSMTPSMSASVTALFNSSAAGSPNPPISSNGGSFNPQDAEAQLKAMLFGGARESASSSGTASPANLPANVQRRVKTVAELEADMHLNSPRKNSPAQANSEDMTAFNKLLIMFKAANEAKQNSEPPIQNTAAVGTHPMMPGSTEFNHAIIRNKEHQLQLQQQSMQQNQRFMQSQQPRHVGINFSHLPPGAPQQSPPPPIQLAQPLPPHGMMNNKIALGIPQAMSTPMAVGLGAKHPVAPNASNPIINMIQQNPTFIRNQPSPAQHIAAFIASQQGAVSNAARVPSPLMFSQQPPLHLSAPSPIHPGQASPRPIQSGMQSPIPSPREMSANAQSAMQGAMIRRQMQEQNDLFLKQQQEELMPTNQPLVVRKSQSTPQSVILPVPQSKGSSVDTFTPTSVLYKMHSDKVDKDRQTQEVRNQDEDTTSYMPSVRELSSVDDNEDKSTLTFMQAVNPNLVSGVTHQMEGLRIHPGQTNILPGELSQPMSVEEKMKLQDLIEKPGSIQQILERNKTDPRNVGQGRAIVKAPHLDHCGDNSQASIPISQHPHLTQSMQLPPPSAPLSQSGGTRIVTGAGSMKQVFTSPPPPAVPMGQAPGSPQSSSLQSTGKSSTGRAMVGSTSLQQPPPSGPPPVPMSQLQQMGNMPVVNPEVLRHVQMMQQHPNVVGPPPPIGAPIRGPPPVGMPVSGRSHVIHGPVHQQSLYGKMNSMNMHQHHRNEMMTAQAAQRGVGPPSQLQNPIQGQLNPMVQSQGPLSANALNATLQRVVSPQGGVRMNGPNTNGGKSEAGGGIRRWFDPDILKTSLPTMPPLPMQSGHVMTVDELERN